MKNGFLLLPKGRTLSRHPNSIVSLVPSQTELLAYLGLDKTVTGITKFCIHPPEWFQSKTKIGGPKKLNFEKIKALHPDLVIANKEENIREEINQLALDFPVYVSDIETLEDTLKMIEDVGMLTHKEHVAQSLIHSIQKEFAKLAAFKFPPIKTAYFIWKSPWMAVGRHTFIHEILQWAGLENVLADRDRYPKFDLEELQKRAPELILLSSEPYPFQEKHQQALQPLFPNTKIILVDGEPFCWYGNRLLHTPEYLIQLRGRHKNENINFG